MVPLPINRDFRKQAHQIVDFIADYLDGGVRDYPVLSRSRPGEIMEKLPPEMPAEGESAEQIWEDFLRIIMPGITH